MVEQYNAEINSLGLTSPSSSTEDSPEESSRLKLEHCETPYESPAKILQVLFLFPTVVINATTFSYNPFLFLYFGLKVFSDCYQRISNNLVLVDMLCHLALISESFRTDNDFVPSFWWFSYFTSL